MVPEIKEMLKSKAKQTTKNRLNKNQKGLLKGFTRASLKQYLKTKPGTVWLTNNDSVVF